MELGLTQVGSLHTDTTQIDKTLTSFIIDLRPQISLMSEDMEQARRQFPNHKFELIRGEYFGFYYYGTRK